MSLIEILTYFDLFDYPLTKEEVLAFSKIKTTEWKNPQIDFQNDYYFLKGRNKIVQIRQNREKYAKKLWKKTYFYLRFLKIVPFLKMVAVCNTLAFNHPEKESDIDLFIITKKKRIWTTRLLTTFLLQILGVRRYGKKVSARFCLSFWCTEEAINLEKIQIKPQDPYLAFWCLTLKPILDNNLHQKFLNENQKWIKSQYNLNFNPPKKNFPKTFQSNFIAQVGELILKNGIGNFLEKKIKAKLEPRSQSKAQKAGPEASIIISDQMLKFHNKDKRSEIYKKWRKKLFNSNL